MSEAKEWIFLKNRATGKDCQVPVTDLDWQAMSKRGHGLAIFEITDRKPIRQASQDYVKRILPVVPDEVKTKPAAKASTKEKDRSSEERTETDAN